MAVMVRGCGWWDLVIDDNFVRQVSLGWKRNMSGTRRVGTRYICMYNYII